jgi:single-strand selective monofunctional uracil DNA glycosylase
MPEAKGRDQTASSSTSPSPRDADHPLVESARLLALQVSRLNFDAPVACTYNPLDYAWAVHEAYLRSFGGAPKRVLFLGMNPGPFGMMQTGVPFGEIAAVRDWLGLHAPVKSPPRSHPRRPVQGFDCPRSEVSGRRLWFLFSQRFTSATAFFRDHFVVNYCPLAFVDEGGRNLTPDKFAAAASARLFGFCDEHLRRVVTALSPQWIIGIGDFAEKRARLALEKMPESALRFGRILHPSPASPAANKDWAGTATRQLEALGVW